MEIMEAEKDLRRVIDPRTPPTASRSPSSPNPAPSDETDSAPPDSSVQPTEDNPDKNA